MTASAGQRLAVKGSPAGNRAVGAMAGRLRVAVLMRQVFAKTSVRENVNAQSENQILYGTLFCRR
jgi:hypothetical protein